MATHVGELIGTLREATAEPFSERRIKVLDYSGATPADNERVHNHTNRLINDALHKADLGTCIHVTGGARALIDPFHRQVLKAMTLKGSNAFKVLCRAPEPGSGPWASIDWNLQTWAEKGLTGWREKLLTLDLVGSKGVDMWAYSTGEGLQYSVFAKSYVQVQGKHVDGSGAKQIWLVQAPELNEILVEKATHSFLQATDIDEAIFADFNRSLYSGLSLLMLKLLSSRPGMERDALIEDKTVLKAPTDPLLTLSALEVIGFVAAQGNGLSVTSDGTEFLADL